MTNPVATMASNEVLDGVRVVGVATAAESPEHYLLFQADVGAGDLGEVHVEIDEQGRSCYGGVASCRLDASHLTVEFDSVGRDAVGCPHVTFALELAPDAHASLRAGLHGLFPDWVAAG